MLDVALDIGNAPTGIALVPGAVELLGGSPKLNNEIAGQILGHSLTAFLAPQADECGLVAAHDDAGVRPADEGAPTLMWFCPQARVHRPLRLGNGRSKLGR
jgi:hypothetical protein